ncbi:SOS response-associated peptidase [uncultured Desulfosarcina sp.]|uniref:SOS response-associated peptidase n=1 Tax=uncultured Desulfosarcina sp. TaxID=218289 RepID=UPI0029C626EF|nr:SOS response-associated peptidase [uncultured Desulfosarcina sp.]
MCGRFVGFRRLEELRNHFPIDVADVESTENFNVAPTQEILAIVRHDDQNHLEKLNWGLVPFWAKDTTIGSRMINARSETVATKPSFRNAFRKRRCLILADGFYEWAGEPGHKKPMFITLPNGEPFAFAGLWEIWDNKGKEKTPYRSATILTREASESMVAIHHRMPVILKPAAFNAWLNPNNQNPESLQEIIQDQIYTELKAVPVSKAVNSVNNNRPSIDDVASIFVHSCLNAIEQSDQASSGCRSNGAADTNTKPSSMGFTDTLIFRKELTDW